MLGLSSGVLAPLLGLLAGALFGVLVHVQRRGLDGTDPLVGAFFSVAAMAGFFWLLAPAFVDVAWFGTRAALLFALGGLFFPAAAQALQVFSLGRAGPAITSAIGAFTPFFAVIPAVAVLGEPLGVQLALGMGLMTGGLVLSAIGSKGIPRSFPLWVLLLPLGAALARGLVQPVTKTGLDMVPSPFFATLVFGTVSTLVLAGVLLATGRAHRVVSAGRGVRWFALGGVVNGCGILALNAAIGLGGVTLAAPLASMSPLWTLALGLLLFRHETLGARQVAMALLVVAGSVLIITR